MRNAVLAKVQLLMQPKWKKTRMMDENDYYDEHDGDDEDKLTAAQLFEQLKGAILAENTIKQAADDKKQIQHIIASLERIGRAQAMLQRILNDNVFTYLQASAQKCSEMPAASKEAREIEQFNKKMRVLHDDLFDLYGVLKENS